MTDTRPDRLEQLARLAFWPLIALAVFATVFPVYLLFKVSIAKPSELLTQNPTFLPHHPTLRHWEAVMTGAELWQPLFKSLTVATCTALCAVLVAAPAAYVISRFPRKLRYTTLIALVLTKMFPDVLIALPVAVTFIRLGLLDTVTGLVLAHLIGNLPFLTWILVGTFETVPRALEEAASIDGCSRLGALFRVVLPSALPGILVGGMFVWLNSWNEFTYALYLSTAQRTLPLQTYFFHLKGSWFDSAAYATLLTIPVVLVTFLLQRYLVAGMMSGAVKG